MYWSEYRRYDVMRDATVARLSMSGDRGGEYWSEVVVGRISEYRKSRDAALDAIEAAVARGDQPGEVRLSDRAEEDVASQAGGR